MTRLLTVVTAVVAAALPASAIAATSTVNYGSVVKANQNAITQIMSIKSGCGSSASAQASCQKQIDKLIKSALFRINSKTASDSALTPAVQRATAKQLLSIFNTSLNCASGSEALCSSINAKTFASLTYRITHQAPISPV